MPLQPRTSDAHTRPALTPHVIQIVAENRTALIHEQPTPTTLPALITAVSKPSRRSTRSPSGCTDSPAPTVYHALVRSMT